LAYSASSIAAITDTYTSVAFPLANAIGVRAALPVKAHLADRAASTGGGRGDVALPAGATHLACRTAVGRTYRNTFTGFIADSSGARCVPFFRVGDAGTISADLALRASVGGALIRALGIGTYSSRTRGDKAIRYAPIFSALAAFRASSGSRA